MGRTTSGAEERALKVFDMECKQLATSCEELARVLQVRYRKLIQKLIQELMFLHVASEYYMQGDLSHHLCFLKVSSIMSLRSKKLIWILMKADCGNGQQQDCCIRDGDYLVALDGC
ncbi:hypothetical protein Dimus_002686 [Dionaea muscipula]